MAVLTSLVASSVLLNLGIHADAGETAVWGQSLRFIETSVHEAKYPNLIGRTLVPLDTSVPAYAESMQTFRYDYAGEAKFVTAFSDDIPLVTTIGVPKLHSITHIAQGFDYNVQEVRVAVTSKTPLASNKALLAQRFVENKIDKHIFLGVDELGIDGLINQPNVPVLSSPGDLTGGWLTGATPAQILADLHVIVNRPGLNTKKAFQANTLVLPPAHMDHIASTTLNTYSDKTILEVFLDQMAARKRPIEVVDSDYLTDGYSGSPMAMAYFKDPEVLKLVLPLAFTMLPPQPDNLSFKVPCEARFGGVVWYQPFAAVYAVGI